MQRYGEVHTADLFNEMLYQIKLLIKLEGGCSEEQIMNQFRNLKGYVVQAVLDEAMKRGIIRMEKCTYFAAV